MKLFVLHAGWADVDKGAILTPGSGDGTTVRIPVPMYLVEHDDGSRTLIDTGMHSVHVEDPGHTFGGSPLEDTITPIMRSEDRVEHRLGELGLGVADVTRVVNTHLHFDHCGQNFLFGDVPILVQRAAYEPAVAEAGYAREFVDRPGLRYELLDGDAEPAPGLRLIVAPGMRPASRPSSCGCRGRARCSCAATRSRCASSSRRTTGRRARTGGRRGVRRSTRSASRRRRARCSSSATTPSSGGSSRDYVGTCSGVQQRTMSRMERMPTGSPASITTRCTEAALDHLPRRALERPAGLGGGRELDREVIAHLSRRRDPAPEPSERSTSRSVTMPGPCPSGSTTTAAPTLRSAMRQAASRRLWPGPETVSTTDGHPLAYLHVAALQFATIVTSVPAAQGGG